MNRLLFGPPLEIPGTQITSESAHHDLTMVCGGCNVVTTRKGCINSITGCSTWCIVDDNTACLLNRKRRMLSATRPAVDANEGMTPGSTRCLYVALSLINWVYIRSRKCQVVDGCRLDDKHVVERYEVARFLVTKHVVER